MQPSHPSRRQFLTGLAAAAAYTALPPGVSFAEELKRTPAQMEGPFYPDHLPLDTDNDLLIVNEQITAAVGEVTHLSGRVLDVNGKPLRSAVVEIWQTDSHGIYLHTKGGDREKLDRHFQGFGRFTTGPTGEYYFRTIKPVAYPGRPAPHIHFGIRSRGPKPQFTTQCYIQGEPNNARDGVLKAIQDPADRALLMVDFVKIPDSKIGELSAKFDIVLGFTPES